MESYLSHFYVMIKINSQNYKWLICIDDFVFKLIKTMYFLSL